MKPISYMLCLLLAGVYGFIPPAFQWRIVDYAWNSCEERQKAIDSGDYIPTHNMPAGLARWHNKLFVTVPRWKKGVPSSLNYIDVNGNTTQPLQPYPSWQDGFVRDSNPRLASNATVVSTFRIHVDHHDRLWVVDNGVMDLANRAYQVAPPSLVIFDLWTDTVVERIALPPLVIRSASVFTSIVVDIPDSNPNDAYAYITDMGSNALVVFSLKTKEFWRIDHPAFKYDPKAGVYNVGGVEFYWNDGVSTATLSKAGKDGHKHLFFYPTSSTKQFRISTKLLRSKNVNQNEILAGVEEIGDRGPSSQVTACDFDHKHNILFFTQVSKNGFGCWNLDKPFDKTTAPIIMSDCRLLEFPNDIKADSDGKLWILSNRQSRFLYDTMNFTEVNFRILTAPVSKLVQGSSCEAKSNKHFSIFKKLIK